MSQHIDRLNQKFKDTSLDQGLDLLSSEGFGNIVFSSSLGQEDQLLTHVIFTNDLPITIFTLDTGRLFEQTHVLLEKTISKYQKSIQVYHPNNQELETFIKATGVNSFYHSVDNRKTCCQIRKTNVLKRVLEGADLWITGLRAQQSQHRQGLDLFQWDQQFQITKYNPLIDWTLDQITNFIDKFDIPQNPLHASGFISVGCAPCTRPIKPGEDIRAGRWWWEEGKKECGLHLN
ncbi:MAG: phosphoadenylyl-sulfate reductase [Flavobacteriaceae bacterium]|nr:phosphoadenylyl-sulfate reductase [Flavobacteriaceae bacterium]MCY4217048.1 phosphoadenylyl-sulfate reductase [Flavobacteriaceae bacterium]MCY4253653.1 phosphoadenylyl-sulfate reductase [Flavobacteriaceae bacterium]